MLKYGHTHLPFHFTHFCITLKSSYHFHPLPPPSHNMLLPSGPTESNECSLCVGIYLKLAMLKVGVIIVDMNIGLWPYARSWEIQPPS